LRNLRIGDLDLAVRLDGGFLTVTVNDELRMGRLGSPMTIQR
jgi:hypothetical protein